MENQNEYEFEDESDEENEIEDKDAFDSYDNIDKLIADGLAGHFICIYCGNVNAENTICCGELHRVEIKEYSEN